jgi:hypothetical protein
MRGPHGTFESTIIQEDPARCVLHRLILKHCQRGRSRVAYLAKLVALADLARDRCRAKQVPNLIEIHLSLEDERATQSHDGAYFRDKASTCEVVAGQRTLHLSLIERTLDAWSDFRLKHGYNPTREELKKSMGIKRMGGNRHLYRAFAAVNELFDFAGRKAVF